MKRFLHLMVEQRSLAQAVLGTLLAGLWIFFSLTPRVSVPSTDFKEIRWSDLTPREWDPTKRFRTLNLDAMRDSDPRTAQLLLQMQGAWDNAPTVSAMDGAAVKLSGYIVPLDGNREALSEFLLVPYFGACIHTPPPPANQIVHVIAKTPASGFKAMDTVWVSGTMRTTRQDSVMGTSGYLISAVRITHSGTSP